MLTAKFRNAFTSSTTGNKRAWYKVSGSSTELEAYKAAQGSYLAFDEDGVTPLISSDCPLDEEATYKIKVYKDRYYVDFSMITIAAGAIESAERRGNARLADQIAIKQADKLMGTTITPSASNALQAAVSATAEPEPAALDEPIKPSAKK